MAEDRTLLGEVLDIFKEALTSGPANAMGVIAQYGSKVGQFFGVVDPKTKNMLDLGREIQLYLENKATVSDLLDRGVQDFVNWKLATHLEELGWGSEMSTVVAGIVSKITGWMAQPLISMATGLISGGHSTDTAAAQNVGMRRQNQLHASNG